MLDLEKNCTLHYFLCMCKVIYFIICYNLDGDIMTYLKVMFGVTSGADRTLNYKIDEVNVADNWNSNASDPKDMGGFNFSNDENDDYILFTTTHEGNVAINDNIL